MRSIAIGLWANSVQVIKSDSIEREINRQGKEHQEDPQKDRGRAQERSMDRETRQSADLQEGDDPIRYEHSES